LNFFFLIFLIFLFYENPSKAIDFQSLETEKGIKFWLINDKSLPLISISFSFKGGAINDPKEKPGLTNLMTSLLDEGTKEFTSEKFKLFMKENGVKIYFSTRKDKVEGTFQVISSQKEQGFWLLHESINNALFRPEQINKVKSQIEASIKIDESDLSTIASDKFNEQFFSDHSMQKKVKGNLRSIKNISREDLMKSYKKALTKNNLAIGIAGDINPDLAIKYIDYVFGDLPVSKEKVKQPNIKSLKSGLKVVDMETPQSIVVFGQRGLGRKDPDYFKARIVNYVLGGGGFQSRLYKEIREKNGLVYSIYSYLMPYEKNGLIVGGFQTRNKTVGKTINKLRNEWLKIKDKGISEKELDNAKAYYKGSFSRNLTSTLSISKLLMTVQYYDLGENYFLERNNIIDNIKIKDVNKVATNLFFEDQLFFMIVGKPVLKTK
tara:strand:+ start:156 stop:1460 length:1305 start_codon:yes stop_codon:yes gene_type:complete